jgi:hypothetical protein
MDSLVTRLVIVVAVVDDNIDGFAAVISNGIVEYNVLSNIVLFTMAIEAVLSLAKVDLMKLTFVCV